MSELGQSRRFDDVRVTSAFPPITTKERTSRDVSNVPLTEVEHGITGLSSHLVCVRSHRGFGSGGKMPFVVNRGVRIHYESIGQGPVLVLHHWNVRERPRHSPPPALLPFFFADQTGHPGLFLGGWDDPALRREACNFENKLGPDRFLEFFAIFDSHDE